MKHISKIMFAAAALLAFAACQKDDRATVKLSADTQISKAQATLSKAADLLSPNYIVDTQNTIASLEDAIMSGENNADAWMLWKENLDKAWESEENKTVDGVAITIYKTVVSLEDVTGKFYIKDNKWVREDAKNLQILWNDVDGIACKLVFNAIDSKNTSLFSKDVNTGEGTRTEECDYLVVPGTISIKMTRGNSTLVSGLVTTSGKLKDTECFYNDAKLNASASLNIQGLEVLLSRFNFKTESFIVKLSIYNGTKRVLKTKLEATDLVWDNDKDEISLGSLESAKKVNIDVDILGEMQFVGEARPDELDSAEELAWTNKNKEQEFKAAVDKMNKAMNIEIFFDGFKKNPQGKIQYAAEFDTESNAWDWDSVYSFYGEDAAASMPIKEFMYGTGTLQYHIQLLQMDFGFPVFVS